MIRRVRCAGWYLAITAVAFTIGAVAQPQKPNRIVWKGVETFENAYVYSGRNSGTLGLANDYYHRIAVSFVYVQETDAQGRERIVSHKIAWTADGKSLAKGYTEIACAGSGEVELIGSSEAEQRDKLKIPCTTKDFSNYFGFFPRPPDTIKPPKLVRWEDLRDNCSYAEEQTHPNGERHTYSAWVASDADAVMEVKTEKGGLYWQFVPEPEKKITFAVRSNIPARFRFKLEDVSHYYGVAGNAAVDQHFYQRYPKLAHLEGAYDSDGPDLIFNPKNFEERDKWNAPAADMLSIETAKDDYGASVDVTAMDFAAYGHLRAEVKGKCGAWEPVRIRVDGKDRDYVTIPLDQNDNLIADRMEERNNGITAWSYAGDLGSDDDAIPQGDSTPGDGLTLFEEYRGFMTASNVFEDACNDSGYDVHVRTDPGRKDLFVATYDPELAMFAPLLSASTAPPGENSGMAVNMICDNRHHLKRRINFTLDLHGPREWHGKTLSRGNQHALRLIVRSLDGGILGQTCGNTGLGPPKNVCAAPNCEDVAIDKEKILDDPALFGPNWHPSVELASVVLHELGHAIGIDHNGDNDIMGGGVLLTESACPEGSQLIKPFFPELPAGTKACVVWSVARRHGQHSGNQDSPMKYKGGEFYEDPGAPLTFRFDVELVRGPYIMGATPEVVTVHGYAGGVRTYRNDLDRPGIGRFPEDVTGTGINALPGEQNHAGDSCRIAAKQIHITDWGPAPVQLIPCPKDSPPLPRANVCTD